MILMTLVLDLHLAVAANLSILLFILIFFHFAGVYL